MDAFESQFNYEESNSKSCNNDITEEQFDNGDGFHDNFANPSADVFTIQDDGQLIVAEQNIEEKEESAYAPPSPMPVVNNFTRHERTTASSSSEKASVDTQFGGAEGRCQVCDDRVYHVEKITTEKHIYHRKCFRCSKCKTALALGNYNLYKNTLYCYNHYIELTRMRDLGAAESNEVRNTDVIKDVVKSGEYNQEDELPRDVTQNVLAKFKELETYKSPSYQPRKLSNSWETSHDSVQLSYSISSSRPKNRDPPPADVVRESDNNDILPENGTTRNMVAMWRNIQSAPEQENGPITTASQNGPRKRFVPPPATDDNLCFPTSYRPNQSRKPAQHREPPADVVRSDEPPPDELPAADTAKSLAARFKALERQGPAPTPEISSRLQKSARVQYGVNANVRLPSYNQSSHSYTQSSNHSESFNREWDPQTRQGLDESAENEPEVRPDCVRENHHNSQDELPESGITRNLLARFQSMGNHS